MPGGADAAMACCSRRSPSRARDGADDAQLQRISEAGGSGPPPKTAGCSCRTARSCPMGGVARRSDDDARLASRPQPSRRRRHPCRRRRGRHRRAPDAASTAALAAAALGVEVGAIAYSLVFFCDGAPLVVMTAAPAASRQERSPNVSVSEAAASDSRAGARGHWPAMAASPPRGIRSRCGRSSTRTRLSEISAAGGTPHTVFR